MNWLPELMGNIMNTSEVWALLIPLLFLLFNKVHPVEMKEVVYYLWIALFLNLVIVTLAYLPEFFPLEKWRTFPYMLRHNAIEYNLHSLARVVLFSVYFMKNSRDRIQPLKKTVLALYLVFFAVNFIRFESPVALFSSRLFTVEAIVLLFFCIYYYLNAISEERHKRIFQQPMFWIVVGLSLYEGVNFCIFLSYTYMIKYYYYLAQHIWTVHNIGFVIFCLFITKAFHVSRRQ